MLVLQQIRGEAARPAESLRLGEMIVRAAQFLFDEASFPSCREWRP